MEESDVIKINGDDDDDKIISKKYKLLCIPDFPFAFKLLHLLTISKVNKKIYHKIFESL